ncbi:MAG TPA: hypothetical protein VL334_06605, partial [Anaerolineae bacterium]|nr:hypothetical protein [Anaerolineae bacterium]
MRTHPPMVLTPAHGSRVLAALRIFCLAVVALHLAAPLFAEANAWGLWPYTYLPKGWQLLLAALAILAILPNTAAALLRIAARALHATRVTFQRRNALFALLSLLSLLLFSLFPIVHTRWGDAHILVNAIAYPDPALRLTSTWQAPLDVWLHARLWALGNSWLGWADAWPAYRMLSPLAGALYVYVLLRLADSVGRTRTEKLLIVGLLATLGTMQLFFGYAENYSLAAAGILLFLWLALDTLAGRRPLWQPALALAVTNGLHPSTIVLDPALLYVAWVWGKSRQGDKETRKQGARVWWSAVWQVAWPMALVAGGVVALMTLSGNGLAALTSTDRPGGGDGRLFVPLTETTTRWEHYTMFSWKHLRDWLNMQMLTAPVTLGGLVIVGVALVAERLRMNSQAGTAKHAEASSDGHALTFLALATGLYWLFTWVWNPDYGGQRDWDLFSLAAI